MTTAAARITVLTLPILAACQPAPETAETRRETATETKTVAATAKAAVEEVEPTEEAVAVAGAGPPLVVVPGRATKIVNCLYDKLAAHAGLASMGLAPEAPRRLESGAFRLQPRKAIRVQLSTTDKKKTITEGVGTMTYTTTVAPAGGNRVAVYFEPKAPDLSGTILHSLMETVRKQTHRQARVCAL